MKKATKTTKITQKKRGRPRKVVVVVRPFAVLAPDEQARVREACYYGAKWLQRV